MALGKGLSEGRRRLGGWGNFLLSTVLILAVWVGATLLFAQPGLKTFFDFSSSRTFTIQEDTRQLLAKLSDDPDIKLEIHTFYQRFQSRRMMSQRERVIVSIQQHLQELTKQLLRQYVYAGGDSVQVIDHDIYGDPKETGATMQSLGLKTAVDVVALRLVVTNAEGGERVRKRVISIPQDMAIVDDPMLKSRSMPGKPGGVPVLKAYEGEKAISQALKQLLVAGVPKIYLLTGHNEEDWQQPTGTGYSELVGSLNEEGFQIGQVDLGRNDIPGDAALLCSLEPKYDFSKEEADKIHAWLRQGGRMFINVAFERQPPSYNVKLEGLLAPLGLALGTDLLCYRSTQRVSDPRLARRLQVDKLSPRHPITNRLVQRGMFPEFLDAREIQALPGKLEGIKTDVRLMRVDNCWEAKRPNTLADPDLAPPHDRNAYRSRCVGALVSVDNKDTPERPGKLILVSGKAFYNRPFKIRNQRDLVLNCFQWLAEREAQIGVRATTMRSHRLSLADDIERARGNLETNTFYLLVVGVPLLFLLLGMGVVFVRSRI